VRAGKHAQNKRDMARKHTIHKIKAGKRTQKKIHRLESAIKMKGYARKRII